ncbi:MAG TPA: Imm70 family immunity protein [Pyrinomonadaceae bacterium]|nr:Imm70 family immunity protein [Pyrinomonadaceae bacterium]
MGLYLCIFDGDEDIDGLEVGSYADYNVFRDYVVRELEGGKAGSRFHTFVMHSDSDGEWSVEECYRLRDELSAIVKAMKTRPPVEFSSEWQRVIAKSVGLVPQNAFESFIDVDGEFLLERLQDLVEKGISKKLPILFQ